MHFAQAYQELTAASILSPHLEIKRQGWRYNTMRMTSEGLKYFRKGELSTREGSNSLSTESMMADDWEVITVPIPSPVPVAPTTKVFYCTTMAARRILTGNDAEHSFAFALNNYRFPDSVKLSITIGVE